MEIAASAIPRRAGDERLVARIRAGDERAFEAVYDRYHASLLAFCGHMLGSREEAEDALQRVFVSAHAQLTRDDRPVRLEPWLYAIARNRCLSMLRARRESVALGAVAEPADGLALAAEVERRQELREMLEDLGRLPEEQRAALVLAEMGDLSQRDIAAALDVRPEKVKALIFQAREALAGWREARRADCTEVREQLATLRGSALRRGSLRRHVAVCAGCAAFEAEVARQRAALALVLPIVPTVALKQTVLAAALGTGEGLAAGAAAAGAGAAAGGLATKLLAVAAVAAGVTSAGAVAVRHAEHRHRAPAAAAAAATAPASPPRRAAPAEAAPAAGVAVQVAGRSEPRSHGRSHAHRGHHRAARVRTRKRPTAPPGRARATRGAARRGGAGGAPPRRPAGPPPGHAKPRPPAPRNARARTAPGKPPANLRGRGALKKP